MGIFSSLLAMVTGSVMHLWELKVQDRRQGWLLRRYLKLANISRPTTLRILRYIDYIHARAKHLVTEDQVELLQQLSDPLRDALRCESFLPHFHPHPVFFRIQ